MKLTTAFFTSILFLSVSMTAVAATGFVDSPLLVSPEAPRDGDSVTLSVLFHNAESGTLNGTVLFYDNQTLLDKQTIVIDPGKVKVVSTTFVISSGVHTFSATMSNVDKEDSLGTVHTVALPDTTFKLPARLVTKNLKLSAQAGGAGSAGNLALLKKVDEAQTAVLKVVPAPVKSSLSRIAKSIDTWRVHTAKSAVKNRDAKDSGKIAEAKHIFWVSIAFFFGVAIVFYIGSLVLIYFVLRFIVRRIRASRGGR